MASKRYTSIQSSALGQKIPMTEAIAHIRSSTQALFMLDPVASRIMDLSRPASTLLQYEHSDLLDTPTSRVHPHDMAALSAFAQAVLSEGEAQSGNLSCLTRSGRIQPVMIHGQLLSTDKGPCILTHANRVVESAHEVSNSFGPPLSTRGPSAPNRRAQCALPLEPTPTNGGVRIVGSSSLIQRALQMLKLVAPTNATVLITGESGTGKEMAARAVHDWSARAAGPLVRVNCAAIPRDLFEAEFFGYVRGAFTGALSDRVGRLEAAEGGTLFLDEIGELPPALQSKLLEVLQEGSYQRLGENRTRTADLRVIAATNRNLYAEVTAGHFREDLYFRLNVFPVEMPPLRDRMSDLEALAKHLASRSAQRLRTRPIAVEAELLRLLREYHWPGNIRELQNYIERATILSSGGLALDAPGTNACTTPDRTCTRRNGDYPMLTEAERRTMTRESILRALQACGGRVAGDGGAANMLGVNPSTLRSRIKSYRIRTH